ncbi:MAG TPA: GIY-YIG nuclease family protein [Chthoniobacterales bacterium]|nr:GIY-YIG nuclease family protein [Chthoniobacterales bacterium]
MRDHDYWVYILTNKHRTTLYIGMTNDLELRLCEHRWRGNTPLRMTER